MRQKTQQYRFLDRIMNLLFPATCIFCARVLEKERYPSFCSECEREIPYCDDSEYVKIVSEKSTGVQTACLCAVRYEGRMRDAVLRYKFNGSRGYDRVFGDILVETVRKSGMIENNSDLLLTWVPVSRKKLRMRGYDQAKLLANQVGRAIGIRPICLLQKNSRSRTQSSTGSAEERVSNAESAYSVLPGVDVSGRNILIIDDILTTGATMAVCAARLQEAGALSVTGAVLAYTDYHKKD